MASQVAMRVVHLLASPFYGGPERQMLGLARHLPADVESVYLSFAERGLARPFIDEVRRQGYRGDVLARNTPHLAASVTEVAEYLRSVGAHLLCCSGYKPDIVGWGAARRAGIPVMGVAHGWTAVTRKVRVYEAIDRWVLGRMDAVVCVSHTQAEKARRARVPVAKIVVIPNAIGEEAFGAPDAAVRVEMAGWFPSPPRCLIGTAGRFSPEKGFGVFIDAAAIVARQRKGAGFVMFGDGPLRGPLERVVTERNLRGHIVMAGFHDDLDRYLPNLDLAVMSSFTEGLPVFLLEASAAGLPAVATSVGGISDVIVDGTTGLLVPPGASEALAARIVELLDDPGRRRAMGEAARARVRRDFTQAARGRRYAAVFARLVDGASAG
jgi:glycosyltransferase involved in cell wall biosynthesis